MRAGRRDKEGGAGRGLEAGSLTAPKRPPLLGRQARASGIHWIASGSSPEIFFVLAQGPGTAEQRQLARHARRAAEHARARRERIEAPRLGANEAARFRHQRRASRNGEMSMAMPSAISRSGAGACPGRLGEADDVLDLAPRRTTR